MIRMNSLVVEEQTKAHVYPSQDNEIHYNCKISSITMKMAQICLEMVDDNDKKFWLNLVQSFDNKS